MAQPIPLTDWEFESAMQKLSVSVLRRVGECGGVRVLVSALRDTFPGQPVWCVVRELERVGLVIVYHSSASTAKRRAAELRVSLMGAY